jgi:hypothetical protein
MSPLAVLEDLDGQHAVIGFCYPERLAQLRPVEILHHESMIQRFDPHRPLLPLTDAPPHHSATGTGNRCFPTRRRS